MRMLSAVTHCRYAADNLVSMRLTMFYADFIAFLNDISKAAARFQEAC